MKFVGVLVILFLLVSLASAVVQSVGGARLGGGSGSLTVLQVPSVDSVCSLQPVYVLVNSVRDTFVEVSIEIGVSVEGPSIPVKPPSPTSVQYRFPVAPLYPGWGIAYIPGLITKSYAVEYKPPIGSPVTLSVKVVSKVVYRVYVNGSVVYEQTYVVRDCLSEVDLKPLAYAFTSISVKDHELFSKTLGLTLPRWVAEAEKSIELIALAINDKEQPSLDVEYSVSGIPGLRLVFLKLI